MKKILLVFLTITLAFCFTTTAGFAVTNGDVETLVISDYNISEVDVSGNTEDGVYAVTVQIVKDSTIVASESFEVNDSQEFTGTFNGLSLAYSTTYTVRAANYVGGTWETTTFTTEAEPYIPPYIPPYNPSTTTPTLMTDAMVQELVKNFTVTTRTENQTRGIKVYVNDIEGLQQIKDAGYTVVYDFYNVCQRAVPKNTQYKLTKVKDKSEAWYLNTAAKKGNKYYYKAVLKVKNAEGEVIAKTTLEQGKYGCRTRK